MINLKNKTPKILVIGDLIVDHYLWGDCSRISPEAPVQVVNVKKETTFLGGAGNVVNNLKTLGAEVDLISVIGKCSVSDKLRELLAEVNVGTQFLQIQKDRISSKKSRVVAGNQQVIRYDTEISEEIDTLSQTAIISTFKKIIKNYDLVLLSDYGKGLLTLSLTQKLIRITNENQKKILVDPKGIDYKKYKGAYLLTPNKKEAGEATHSIINNIQSTEYAIKKLKKLCDLKVSLITLSEEGIAIFDDRLRVHPTVSREVFDVTGAGDTVLASLGYALSCNLDIDEAVKFANLASGVVVGKIGTGTATINEIIDYESSLHKSNSSHHIKTFNEISSIVSDKKSKGQKIVFTNGCFDILHAGHVKYLEEAKNCGDILVLGLNSDASVKKIKGSDRPINSQNDRAYILASLEVVDYLVIFDTDTPLELIQLIQPDVLVKGGDYKNKYVVGQDIAKELKLIEFIPGKSTSKLIKKIKQ